VLEAFAGNQAKTVKTVKYPT